MSKKYIVLVLILFTYFAQIYSYNWLDKIAIGSGIAASSMCAIHAISHFSQYLYAKTQSKKRTVENTIISQSQKKNNPNFVDVLDTLESYEMGRMLLLVAGISKNCKIEKHRNYGALSAIGAIATGAATYWVIKNPTR